MLDFQTQKIYLKIREKKNIVSMAWTLKYTLPLEVQLIRY
jgi:hypothetical protein